MKMTAADHEDLSASVAEAVFCWHAGVESHRGETLIFDPSGSAPKSVSRLRRLGEAYLIAGVPQYSRTFDGAGAVIDAMRERMAVRLRTVEYSDGWYATFARFGIDAAPWLATQEESFPVAVCRAATLYVLREQEGAA